MSEQQVEQKHTAEPWRMSTDGCRIYAGDPADSIAEECRRNVASFGGQSTNGSRQAQDRANAERIIQCVNALQGIPSPEQALDKARWALYATRAYLLNHAGGYENVEEMMASAGECAVCGSDDEGSHADDCPFKIIPEALDLLTPPHQQQQKGSE